MSPSGGQTKDICLRGHDTTKVGRTKSNQCRECMRERRRMLFRIEPRVPELDIEERMDLEAHLLKVHGMTLQSNLSLLRLKAAHEWRHVEERA